MALAASIWPSLAGWTSRLARLLFLFVILKPVTLIVLAFAGNAALAGLSLNGTFASSAGTIIAAITIFALAAMAPWALMLIVAADSESAMVGAGVRAAAGHARSDGAATLGTGRRPGAQRRRSRRRRARWCRRRDPRRRQRPPRGRSLWLQRPLRRLFGRRREPPRPIGRLAFALRRRFGSRI